LNLFKPVRGLKSSPLFHKIKYYFIDKEGRSYYVNNAGNVDKSSSPKPLELAPEGGKSISIGYERSMTDKELGVVRSFTLPTDFVRKAGKILKSIVYSKNVAEKIYLLIQKLKVTVDLAGLLFRMQYQFLYKGEVDLTSFSDKDTRTSVTVSEGGIAKQIKAKDDTTFEIDLDSDTEAILIKHDGINLYDTANFIVTPIEIPLNHQVHFVPVAPTTRDGTAAGFAAFQNFGDPYSGNPNSAADSDKFAFTTTEVIVGMKLSGSIKLQFNLNGAPSPTARYVVCLNSNLRPGVLFNTPGIAYLTPNGNAGYHNLSQQNIISFDFDVTIDTQKDEKFFIYAYNNTGALSLDKQEYLETSFKIEFKSRYKTTYVKGLKLSTLGKRLIKKITGNENDIDISFLTQHDNLVFSSGDGIRGLAGAKIKTSLKEYKDFIWVVLAASRGIENGKLIFEEFSHFLNPGNPIALGEIAKFETTVAKDLLCSKVHVGYPVQQIDDINGKLSFHNTLYFSSPLDLEEPKALDLVTNYIACPFYQEIIRINLEGRVTTDDKSDNDVMVFNTEKQSEVFIGTDILIDTATVDGNYFFINGVDDKIDLFKTKFTVSGTVSNDGTYTVKKVVSATSGFNVFVNENIVTEVVPSAQFTIEFYNLYRPTYTSFAGVPEIASLYNIEELSPKRILLKHAKWINSIFYGLQGQKITYESTEKNADFATTRSGIIIKEKAPYEIATTILFKPFYFELETMVPVTTVEDLDADRNRCFLPEWYGDTYKGFSRKIGASVNDNKSQQFKLLCSPDTDVTKLIF
jgi:hypothetical protein